MLTVVAAGYLPRDPDIKEREKGDNLVMFTLGVFASKKDIFYVRCLAFEHRLGPMAKWMKKGSRLIVTGRMKPPSIYSPPGRDACVDCAIYVSDVQFLPRGDKDANEETIAGEEERAESPSEEELPF
jgi:single-stranded DNA-binding protein